MTRAEAAKKATRARIPESFLEDPGRNILFFEVESFEFSVNEQTGSDEEVEALAETDEDEVETFDFGSFSMDEPSEQDAGNDAQSAEDSGDEAEEAEDILSILGDSLNLIYRFKLL